MSIGPWKKYKKKKLKGIDGKRGFVFENKKVNKDKRSSGLMYLPGRFSGKKLTVIVIEEGGEEIVEKNKDLEELEVNVFK